MLKGEGFVDKHLPLEVKFGTIFNGKTGIAIDNMAIIVDSDAGMMKYGEYETIEKYYQTLVEKFSQAGHQEYVKGLILISFNRYEGILTIDEICTLINYILLSSANGEQITRLMSLDKDALKAEIAKLKNYGY